MRTGQVTQDEDGSWSYAYMDESGSEDPRPKSLLLERHDNEWFIGDQRLQTWRWQRHL